MNARKSEIAVFPHCRRLQIIRAIADTFVAHRPEVGAVYTLFADAELIGEVPGRRDWKKSRMSHCDTVMACRCPRRQAARGVTARAPPNFARVQ